MSADECFQAAVEAISKPENRFDVTIICTTDDHQAEFWMTKLKKGGLAGSTDDAQFPMVIGVSEDWTNPSGAGNGLGTLYAWTKAVKFAKEKYNVDLESKLADGSISAALYHTAGKGTRMAPLPASENNNKPGVKLPFCQAQSGDPITVLESVVQQTGMYASSRKGRLSVFWGDQVFLPSVPFVYTPTHHVDILCTLLGETAPNAQEWKEQGLEKYGVIAVVKQDGVAAEAAQVEKVDHATAVKMLESLGQIQQVGPSLGSFSVSAAFLSAICNEFATELANKQAKFDTDPHFWMPLTLKLEDYISLMQSKGIESDVSVAHYNRMGNFKSSFDKGTMGLFGAVDVGKDACWWDYGQLKLYSTNTLLILADSKEAKLLRQFLGVTTDPANSDSAEGVKMQHSYTFGSKIAAGSVKDSVVCRVSTKELDADGAIIVNCAAPKITAGKGAILYNITSKNEIVVGDGEVKVEVMKESGESMILSSRMDIDGGKAWKQTVEGNPCTFEETHKNNKESNISKIDIERTKKYDEVVKSCGI